MASQQGDSENSTEGESNSSFFEEVPENVLDIILKQTIPETAPNFNSLFPFRLVNSQWKSRVDSILEKRTLAGFSKWIPHDPLDWLQDPIPDNLPKPQVYIVRKNEVTKPCGPCPKPIARHNKKNPPYAQRSLNIGRSQSRLCSIVGNNVKIFFEKFLGKGGHHLSSLNLQGLHVKPSTLVGILKHVTNLKALRIAHLTSSSGEDMTSSELPSLQSLRTLLLIQNRVEDFKMNKWLVDAYSKQIINLEVDIPEQFEQVPPLSSHLENMKQLKIYRAGRNFLQSTGSALLERLSLIGSDTKNPSNIHDFLQFIEKFHTTLAHLHLDNNWTLMMIEDLQMKRRAQGQVVKAESLRDDPCLKGIIEMNDRLQSNLVIFPKLKILTIPYPKDELERAFVKKTILPKFPELEKLQFIRMSSHFWLYPDHQDIRKRVGVVLEKEDYWKSCPKLKRISVVGGGVPEERPVHVSIRNSVG